jgi:hypothetical protein
MAKMHADEYEIDIDLVRRLLANQFPHWSNLTIMHSEDLRLLRK